LKHKELHHQVYYRQANMDKVMSVRRPDRKDVLNYLTGRTETSSNIDETAPIHPPSNLSGYLSDDDEDELVIEADIDDFGLTDDTDDEDRCTTKAVGPGVAGSSNNNTQTKDPTKQGIETKQSLKTEEYTIANIQQKVASTSVVKRKIQLSNYKPSTPQKQDESKVETANKQQDTAAEIARMVAAKKEFDKNTKEITSAETMRGQLAKKR